MKESTENRVAIDDILIRVDFINIVLKDRLAAANKYLLNFLKFEFWKFLSERIKKENCVKLLALADLLNAVLAWESRR